MFEHSLTKESLTSELVIDDFDYHAVLIMLQWFYSAEFCAPYTVSLYTTLKIYLCLQELRKLYLSDELHSCENKQSTSTEVNEDLCNCFELDNDLLLQCTELAHK